jgi:cellulose synthase/poly-beta-1,6-N-acetylglucosamine synthase-like glycosyltransferase
MNEPFISVIIPVFNEAEIIDRKIRNTLAIDYPMNKMEIIVVDDGSTDGTCEKIEMSSICREIRIIRTETNRGKSHALNIAVAQSKGEIIVMTDADTLLSKDAIRKLISNFLDENVGLVFGKEQVFFETLEKSIIKNSENQYQSLYDLLQKAESSFDSCIIVNGGLYAIRKKVYELFRFRAVAEDTCMGISTRRKGFRVVYEDEAVYYHAPSGTLLGAYNEKKRRAFGIVQAIMKNKDMLFNKRYGGYGCLLLPIKFSMFVICPFALPLAMLSILVLVVSYLSSLGVSLYLHLSALMLVGLLVLVGTRYDFIKNFAFLPFYIILIDIAMIHSNLLFLFHKEIRWNRRVL